MVVRITKIKNTGGILGKEKREICTVYFIGL